MIRFRLIGLEDGEHEVDLDSAVTSLEYLPEEFKGNVILEGKLRIFGTKAELSATAFVDAEFECDRSQEVYTEELEADINLVFHFSTDDITLMDEQKYDEGSYFLEGNKLDISKIVCDELILSVPMKKISPEYRDMEISDLYPGATEEENKAMETEKENPFAKLKNINLN